MRHTAGLMGWETFNITWVAACLTLVSCAGAPIAAQIPVTAAPSSARTPPPRVITNAPVTRAPEAPSDSAASASMVRWTLVDLPPNAAYYSGTSGGFGLTRTIGAHWPGLEALVYGAQLDASRSVLSALRGPHDRSARALVEQGIRTQWSPVYRSVRARATGGVIVGRLLIPLRADVTPVDFLARLPRDWPKGGRLEICYQKSCPGFESTPPLALVYLANGIGAIYPYPGGVRVDLARAVLASAPIKPVLQTLVAFATERGGPLAPRCEGLQTFPPFAFTCLDAEGLAALKGAERYAGVLELLDTSSDDPSGTRHAETTLRASRQLHEIEGFMLLATAVPVWLDDARLVSSRGISFPRLSWRIADPVLASITAAVGPHLCGSVKDLATQLQSAMPPPLPSAMPLKPLLAALSHDSPELSILIARPLLDVISAWPSSLTEVSSGCVTIAGNRLEFDGVL